jgi:hypothetical protein
MNTHNFLSVFATATLALALLIAGAACQPEAPLSQTRHVRYVVGLSPFLDESASDEAFRQIVRLLLEDMPLNSSLWLYDAYHVRTITQIDIPNGRAFESGRTRANQFADRIQLLKSFLASPHKQPEEFGPDISQAVRFPQFMHFVGENLNPTNCSVVAIVLGSPLYLDEKEPAFSMVDGFFPSDGHLFASAEKSIFGLKDAADSLPGVAVHFGYFGDPWANELHQQKVTRFWNLFLKLQGAQLATFTGDLPTIFNAVRGQAEAAGHRVARDEIDSTQTKVEMLRISREVGVTDWITRDLPAGHRPPPPTKTVGPMKIGIRWHGDIDLDLYARPNRRAETLFFQHTRTPEGYYFKDHRSSPDHEYEFIEFTEPVDAHQVEAHINFYEGKTPGGPGGEIRIEFQGRIYTQSFILEADHGNQGRGGDRQRAFWTVINIPQVLELE